MLVGPESEFKKMTRAEKKQLRYNKVNGLGGTEVMLETRPMMPVAAHNFYAQD